MHLTTAVPCKLLVSVSSHHCRLAGKVYKELFRSSGSAVLVDTSGTEYQCVVQSEARNDMRPQFTLRVRTSLGVESQKHEH